MRFAVSVGLGSIICVLPLPTRWIKVCSVPQTSYEVVHTLHTLYLVRGRPGKVRPYLLLSHSSTVYACDDCFASLYIVVSGLKIVTAGLLMHVHVLDFNYEVRHNPVLMFWICFLGVYEYGA